MAFGKFKIDRTNSDDKFLYIDIAGKGTVVIKDYLEGIVVEIYPFHVVDEPVASAWANMSDLTTED